MERINKFLAHAGLGSRRHCEELVLQGRVKVDGDVIQDLATRVEPDQKVMVDGKLILAEKFVYWMVYKPPGYLCTNHDPAGRLRAIDLIPEVTQRVYTVGRLDEESEGMLLLTNDGDLANRLMHPRYGVEKTYHVQVAGSPTREDLQRLVKGIYLAEGHVKARSAKKLKQQGNSTWLEIVLSEGKNREIRRMLARFDHKVMRIIRRSIGPLEMGRLKLGQSRHLSTAELNRLRRATPVARGVEEDEIPEE